jgi:hypothetical protein
MKVYSLYDKDKTFLGAFPSRDMCVTYAKVLHHNADGWDYDIIEEYLSKSPLTYSSPLTPSQTIPCNPSITLLPGTPKINPDPYPHIYCDGTK